ncbi:hypothetical protein BJ878DRAFT_527860 [Calycina marina]|uniref:NADH dehydrogenase subunit 5 n=1 Tax=Calycina marina TaxID=1763456 RepID=A0A9P7YUY6_9HELO|nr:hypothetical protein BJ878DRAFT_527860 [Calycina marina]
MLANLALTWLVFRIRNIDGFPLATGSLAILPTTCFESSNAASALNATFTGQNISQILLDPGTSTAAKEYQFYFLPLAVIALLSIFIFPLSSLDSWNDYGLWSDMFVFHRFMFTIPLLTVAGTAT